MSTLDTALELLEHGYSVIPIKTDGSKAPALPSWKRYTTQPPTQLEVSTWFTDDQHDLGVVQGAVSGNAELTELEGRAVVHLPDLKALADDTGLGALWATVTSGWVEMSPSGGFHFHYRLDGPVPGNLKLARGVDKLVLAETRGEGGQVVVAPSHHHATGRPWVRLTGGPATAPVLSLEQRDAFHAILRTLDEQPDQTTSTGPAPAPHDPTQGITPGDDYENRTDWADILTPHGWTLAGTRGRTRYWLRPGKPRGAGISATTGHADDRDRLFVFTSSTDFVPEVPYTKLGAYAVLEHAGDLSAAGRALYAAGHGQRAEQRREVHATRADLEQLIAPTTEGDIPWTSPAAPATSRTSPVPTVPAPVTSGTAASTTGAPASAAPAEAGASEPAPSITEPGTYTETDDGNALRLIDTHGAGIRYVPQRGQWLTWNTHRWVWDEAGHVAELARDTARNLPTHDRAAERHRKTSLSRRGVEAMVALARTDPRTSTHLANLDAHPYELNTPTGTVNLRTGTLSQPDPTHLHTRSTAVAPNPDQPCPAWKAFLADTFAGDPDLTSYVQRLLGLSLVGTVLEQLLPFAHGPGANGKTTLLSVVQRLVGVGDDGYSISAPAELLLATHQQGHPTEIARLAGARLVVTSELEDGQRFAEARIKQLTGRDVISGRFMRQDWFSFRPTHTLWLLANTQPAVRAGGPAFWRRLRLLPFEHTVPVETRDAGLEDRLVETEGPAILAWLVQGAATYFAAGLSDPASVTAATGQYERDTDTVARFVDDACQTGNPNAQHLQTKVAVLRAAYERWCRAEGEEPVSPKALTQQLRSRYGVLSERDSAVRWYSGITLTDVSSDGAEPSPEEPSWRQETGW